MIVTRLAGLGHLGFHAREHPLLLGRGGSVAIGRCGGAATSGVVVGAAVQAFALEKLLLELSCASEMMGLTCLSQSQCHLTLAWGVDVITGKVYDGRLHRQTTALKIHPQSDPTGQRQQGP